MPQIGLLGSATCHVINRWQFAMSLLTGSILPSDSWKKLSFRLKFFARALLSPRLTTQLLGILANNSLLAEILSAQPHLPCKLHRPYLAANMSKSQALCALKDHYSLFKNCLPMPVFLGALSKKPYLLTTFTGKNEERYTLCLSSFDKLNKEGETTVLLADGKGEILALVTFSLIFYKQQKTLFIGGLQGAAPHVPHETIQANTKACHGLFPKRLVIEAICRLAELMEMSQIVAVGKTTHIYQNWRYRQKKKNSFLADYDSFWLSLSGKQTADGYFVLPGVIKRKSLGDIASKKKS